ncbi:MAG: hypothetical protein AAGF26_16190 [Cyanobacteria bacterium P01_G01_bin.49]
MRIVIKLETIFDVSLVLVLLFIFSGDKVLPNSLGTVSANTRTTLQKAIAKFIAEEKAEFSRLKGGDEAKRSKFKLQKPDEYFDRAVEQAEKQTNVTN